MIANVELSWLAPSKLRRTVIVGSKKMVVYEDGAAEAIRIFDRGVVYRDPETFGEYHLSYRTGDILSPQLSSDEPLAIQTAALVRLSVLGCGTRAQPDAGERRCSAHRSCGGVARAGRRANRNRRGRARTHGGVMPGYRARPELAPAA